MCQWVDVWSCGYSVDMGAPRPAGDFEVPRREDIEGARLLANENRDELADLGLSDEEIRKLADDYLAQKQAKVDPAGFVPWVRERVKRGDVP
jgi:hypothetical protein